MIGQIPFSLFHQREDLRRPLLEQHAGIGQGDLPFAAQQQFGAQSLFQVRQLPADGGLGDVEQFRRPGDVPHFGHCQKIFQ